MKLAAMILLIVSLVWCQSTLPAPTPDIAGIVAATVEAALPIATPTPTPNIEATASPSDYLGYADRYTSSSSYT